jgi:ABC-type transport system substrate-binding protein
MKLSEKIDGRIRRQGWFRVGGVLILAIALASVQAPAQQLATPLATAGESVIAPELAQAHPVIAQYHWSKLPNHAGKPKYGGTLHLDLRNEPTNWDPFTGNTGTLGWGSIDAAQAIGCSDVRIMLAHILPNIVAPVIVLASVLFGNAIIIEASLSFLGLGTPPPTPSWGAMLSGAGRQFMERVPTLALFPGLAISIAVLAFNLFGDLLRDILDPRLRSGSA